MTLFASAGTRGEAPSATSPTPATNAAWFSRAWQSEEGLPGNTVVGVAQTPDGFLWVATESGLARFDGVRFQETASSGNLWLGYQGLGVGRLRQGLHPDRVGAGPRRTSKRITLKSFRTSLHN